VHVIGFKKTTRATGITLYQYQDKCSLVIDTGSSSFPSSKSIWQSDIIPSECKPRNPKISINYANENTRVSLNGDGHLYRYTTTGQSISASCWCQLDWSY
jgi:hypothetical protein